jgi:hypothetical protein
VALCFDEDSKLLTKNEGEALFDAEGQPTPTTKNILGFLNHVEQNRKLTQLLCQSLADHNLLQAWPIKVQTEDGKQKTIQGLLRIDEEALNKLGSSALQALQRSGALAIAYMQLLSMQHLIGVANLARALAEQDKNKGAQSLVNKSSGELDLEFLNGNGTFSFDTK